MVAKGIYFPNIDPKNPLGEVDKLIYDISRILKKKIIAVWARRKKAKMIMKNRCIDSGKVESKNNNVNMVASGFYIPKSNPEKPLGEDAHFICEEESTMGVADGVGGWAKHGIDAGEYARELMLNVQNAVKQEPEGYVNLKRVLDEAYLQTKANGSSTASIVTVDNDQVFHGINVGDSGFMIFRNNKLLYRSMIQQHRFNRPYQLGNDKRSDTPKSAQEYRLKVQDGDIVILGSDGLWDNVFVSEIEKTLMLRNVDGKGDVHDLASFIGQLAFSFSMDGKTFCPFAEAAKHAGQERVGGKVDDITVLVGRIVVQ
ncbi:probable protein phosphatase 2C 55 [Arachis stenosperma]|uniref:probable protein phosphatase 2C 55 n=1 Tax=Arachis stenosperma TaxID=217475 RepID=UPI0025AC058E|nr:probable protein phosphatase 2C 55 [Arachis stenosperma]